MYTISFHFAKHSCRSIEHLSSIVFWLTGYTNDYLSTQVGCVVIIMTPETPETSDSGMIQQSAEQLQ